MKLTFLERLMVWLAKLAQIAAIVKAKPEEPHVMMIKSLTGHDPVKDSGYLSRTRIGSDYDR